MKARLLASLLDRGLARWITKGPPHGLWARSCFVYECFLDTIALPAWLLLLASFFAFATRLGIPKL